MNISNLLSLAASPWLKLERKVVISVAMVGREYIASLMMVDLKPTDCGDSNGANFDATRDKAWRIDSNSGRPHYVSHN